MNTNLFRFLMTGPSNAIQTLNFLLFLYKHPCRIGTPQDFAHWLFWGSDFILENIIAELKQINIIVAEGDQYYLSPAPEVRQDLQNLAVAFDDPLLRQEIIDRLRHRQARS